MPTIIKCFLPVAVLVLLGATDMLAQKPTEPTWKRYSPDGSAFALSIPGDALLPQGHIFDPKGSVDVYRLIEPGQDVRVFNFETELNGKSWFLASILQISRKDRKLPTSLVGSKASVINTIIGDDLKISEIVTKKNDDAVRFQWLYDRMNQGRTDFDGAVLFKISAAHAIVLVIECKSCDPHTADIQRVLDSL